MIKKPVMNISFSGGRTSAFMTWWLLANKSDEYDFVVTFANTGQEHPLTLEFIDNCDACFGFNTVWLEAVVHHGERKSNGFKVVDFASASRNGEPYEEIIRKHGIPNMAFPHCTRELKKAPIDSYIRSLGLKRGDFVTAIGIRADETRRVRKDADTANIVYPLIDMMPVDKQDVLDWWSEQPFDLQIQEHQGNCTWCWKKSIKKHFMLISESPEIYDFPRDMEAKYPHVGPHKDKSVPRTFFRGNVSTVNLFAQYALAESVPPASDPYADGGCSESCELYPTEG